MNPAGNPKYKRNEPNMIILIMLGSFREERTGTENETAEGNMCTFKNKQAMNKPKTNR